MEHRENSAIGDRIEKLSAVPRSCELQIGLDMPDDCPEHDETHWAGLSLAVSHHRESDETQVVEDTSKGM